MVRERYLRRNPAAILRLSAIDVGLAVRAVFASPRALPTALDRVLIANPAHIGDAIILTGLLRYLLRRNASIKVGVLVGSWARKIFEGHPGVESVHCLDHWRLDRSAVPAPQKKAEYHRRLPHIFREISAKKYDIAFCAYAYEPSLIPLLHKYTSLPIVGFVSAGYGPLLSHACDQGDPKWHDVQRQAYLFEPWLGSPGNVNDFSPWLPHLSRNESGGDAGTKRYIVVHPGSGNPAKEWPVEKWLVTVKRLHALGVDVIVTGSGEREYEVGRMLAQETAAENLVGRLEFESYVRMVSRAQALVAVDSMAGHLAAAFSIPTVILASGIGRVSQWRPIGRQTAVLSEMMPCSPCHTRPCLTRACITSIEPEAVITALRRLGVGHDAYAHNN